MSSPGSDRPLTEPPQRARFGHLREIPPGEVLKAMPGAGPDEPWTVERFGNDYGYPNGGIWQVTADRPEGGDPFRVWVKRTGAGYLGESRVWRCRFDPGDPQWWGREAAFYESDLATSGWTADVRAAQCYVVDDHDGCRDLWLEHVDVPASLDVCRQAAAGLATWQVAHSDAKQAWLSEDWIPVHVRRHGLDNRRTLAHPGWEAAIDRGLDPVVREVAEARITDPAEIRRQLREFPQVLTHYDFHSKNIGAAGGEVAVLDWAFVGWGPIGHDAGHLALNAEDVPGVSAGEVWDDLQAAYCDALIAAGWSGDPAVVRRSMAVSNLLRLGWTIDHLLSVADKVPDDTFAAMSAKSRFLAGLQ